MDPIENPDGSVHAFNELDVGNSFIKAAEPYQTETAIMEEDIE